MSSDHDSSDTRTLDSSNLFAADAFAFDCDDDEDAVAIAAASTAAADDVSSSDDSHHQPVSDRDVLDAELPAVISPAVEESLQQHLLKGEVDSACALLASSGQSWRALHLLMTHDRLSQAASMFAADKVCTPLFSHALHFRHRECCTAVASLNTASFPSRGPCSACLCCAATPAARLCQIFVRFMMVSMRCNL
jgi:hypothetical protein